MFCGGCCYCFFSQQKDLPAELQNEVSPQAVYMIVNLEGCVRNPYKCPADVWTNGVGNTHNVDKSKVLTIDEVAADLRRNIKEAENCINADFNGRKMNQGQYDAMVSLAFNLGCGNIKRYYSKNTHDITYNDSSCGKSARLDINVQSHFWFQQIGRSSIKRLTNAPHRRKGNLSGE